MKYNFYNQSVTFEPCVWRYSCIQNNTLCVKCYCNCWIRWGTRKREVTENVGSFNRMSTVWLHICSSFFLFPLFSKEWIKSLFWDDMLLQVCDECYWKTFSSADYNILEDVKRVAESAKRMRQELCGYNCFRLPIRKNLLRTTSRCRTKILSYPTECQRESKIKRTTTVACSLICIMVEYLAYEYP